MSLKLPGASSVLTTTSKNKNPRIHNLRPCPSCHELIYGMPGGRDAVCHNCGFKDPCCND